MVYLLSGLSEAFLDDYHHALLGVSALKDDVAIVIDRKAELLESNVARLKQLTGRDMITARFLHENEIKFYPPSSRW